ncbi:MAG: metal ABC transporter permease [Deltaproteobacteria bacterium]|nr:metal ABC transporter permease [Deltaproteobacteria bacterium]MBZ0219887.1 metal ABC transporter permease [Deltaproteobacteria bacterium]
MEALSFLAYPFLGCVLLILIHAYFGIHILERGVIFLDLALAQFIGLGISVAFYMGHEDGSGRYVYAVVFAIIGASILSLSSLVARYVNIEAFIGVFYVCSLAASMLVLDSTPHGLDELKAILNGNILWVTPGDLLKMSALYSSIGLVHLVFRKKFLSLSFERRGSYIWELIFFVSFALVLVSSVSTAGVLQVFSFLVIPALIGGLFTRGPLKILLIGWGVGIIASAFGLMASFKMDLPTAPLFITFLGTVFFALLIIKAWRTGRREH